MVFERESRPLSSEGTEDEEQFGERSGQALPVQLPCGGLAAEGSRPDETASAKEHGDFRHYDRDCWRDPPY